MSHIGFIDCQIHISSQSATLCSKAGAFCLGNIIVLKGDEGCGALYKDLAGSEAVGEHIAFLTPQGSDFGIWIWKPDQEIETDSGAK